jgi:hypothetical protein
MNIPEMEKITARSYDPETGSCILSIRKLNIVKRIQCLITAIEAKQELEEIEQELKKIAVLIRNLPRKKRKLSARRDELNHKYNNIIETEELPLKKLI